MGGVLSTAALLLAELQFAPVPPNMLPRNAIERLVLSRSESASRELERLLAEQQDQEASERQLVDAGFKRVRPDDACANYVYTRQLTATLVRGASIIMCEGKPPFVLRTDEAPGPFFAPMPGQPAAVVPSAPK